MLTDAWAEANIVSSGTGATFTLPRAVPSGAFLAVAVGRSGGSILTSLTDMRGSGWVIQGAGAHTTNTLNVALATLRVGTALQAGDTVTMTFSATGSNTCASFGVFNDVTAPTNGVVMPAIVSTAAIPVNAGPTPSLPVGRALVLTAASTTGNGYPFVNLGNAKASTVVTNQGSGNRGSVLLYKYEGGYTHTGSFSLAGSVISTSVTAAFQSTPLPPGTLPVMTTDGEVPGVLSWWVNGVEVPVVSAVGS